MATGRKLKIGEPIGATDPNDELIQVSVNTADYFEKMLNIENERLDKIRTDILSARDTICQLSNQITRDELRVRLGEQRVVVWEFAHVKAKSLGVLKTDQQNCKGKASHEL